ncbi:MAG TPA: alpha-2-macroglobulin family protein, partial [Flavipsychrobacter sp.]|nr:alpha-2-macroglobulin family protein [Flavipsychrobacter sp.]
QLLDSASPALAAARREVHAARARLVKKLESVLEDCWNILSALAGIRIAQLMMPERVFREYENKTIPVGSTNYAAIKSRLDNIIARFPESEGGILAQQMLQQILAKSLNLTVEEVVLPNEPSKMLVSYRNVGKASIRLLRLNNADTKWIGTHYGYDEKRHTELLSIPAIKTWSTDLPDAGDYDNHSTEVKIDALPIGTYAVLISADERFSKSDNIISYAIFQVSQLSAVNSTTQGFVLDRKTGMPLQNASVDLFRQRYNDNIRGYDLVKVTTISTDKNGAFNISQNTKEDYNAIRIRYQKDTVVLTGYFSGREYKQENKSQTQTFFFTDRAIYRPGQTIFFKGIMVNKEEGGRKNNAIANEKTEVTLYDVNGQKVTTKQFTTNEFGSFSGSFTAPEGLLNGNMQIRNASGTIDFSVEDYKRPKFAVVFDTLRKAYALNETITVTGNAKAYAGNAIDNATVKYRVLRQTRFPYWWASYRWGFPRSAEMEIENGTATTDAQGNFSIDFKAIPDLAISPESMPVFTYTVSADVTDINGETHSGSTRLSVGYTSLKLSINLPDRVKPEDLDTFSLTSVNLNDQFVKTDVQLKISRLKQPETMLRKRLWETPDKFVMDSLTFKKYFPNDVYNNEDDKVNWTIEQTVLERKISTNEKGQVVLPVTYKGKSDTYLIDLSDWQNGWYVIEATTTDKNGKKITEKKYIQVYAPDNKGSITDALIVVPPTGSKEPGATATVYTATGYKSLHLIQQTIRSNGKDTKHIPLSFGEGRGEAFSITEADRGGILVSYITVKENRFYTQQAFINVPWSNKDLNISWETHRDKLLPGSKETWTMVISGNKKEKVAAEMVATLYDASLDAFRPHEWNVYGLFPSLTPSSDWNGFGFGQRNGEIISNNISKRIASFDKRYDALKLQILQYGIYSYRSDGIQMNVAGARKDGRMLKEVVLAAPSAELQSAAPKEAKEQTDSNVVATPALRKNLQETAFFYPELKTDKDGNIRIEFTIPEALTEWKLLAFAHTKDMSYGKIEGTVKTQKDLMVMPNLPRFLRQGDEIIISTKISNLSDKELSGTATLELLNALTMQPVNLPFRLQQKDVTFSVAKAQSTTASWKLHVPESLYEPVVVRISAKAGAFTDGEENVLPVITNRMLVTETLPLWMNGYGTKSFSFDKLKYSDTSHSLVHQALTVEYTSNPAWYAVKALPYLMEYPYECAEQTFNRYYATALAAHIVAQSPKIKAIFENWKNTPDALISQLEKNQELKSALLEETPWVLEAKNETEQRKRIGELFDTYKLSEELDGTARKLKDMQLPEGGFPWFKGMRSDRFITQYIITGLGRLQQLGVKDTKGTMQDIIAKALPYLDREMKHSYDQLVKNKANLEQQEIGYTEVQYLYMHSFFKNAVASENMTAFNFYRKQAAKYWAEFNPYMKGMIAIALHRNGDKQTPATIIQSLKETAIHKEERGMYWMQRGQSYWWYEAPIEAQSLLIECFKEVANDVATVNEMKVWLLKNKQTNNWETTKATADACYALLLSGTDWLTNEPKVTIHLGNKTITSTEEKQEAGSGYFKVRIEGKEVKPEMGNITLSVTGDNSALNTQNSTLPSWGAAYWQYFEDLDKISSAKTPLEIKKQLFIQTNTSRGQELAPITSTNTLHVGDKLTVRIEITVDRDMEYVHLKDMRASAFEPINVISAYKWQGGLGYYESTKDVSTNFFFDRLPKGKYVFEYHVFVQQVGDFSNGIATIQCMYAPEFSSHSEGMRVKVQ